jgi:hypothetical protein
MTCMFAGLTAAWGNSPIRMGPLLLQEALQPQETNPDTPRPRGPDLIEDQIPSNFGYYEYGRFCSISASAVAESG